MYVVLSWQKNVSVEIVVSVKVKNPLSACLNPLCRNCHKLEDETFESARLFKSIHFVTNSSNYPRVEVFHDGCRQKTFQQKLVHLFACVKLVGVTRIFTTISDILGGQPFQYSSDGVRTWRSRSLSAV